MRAWKLTLSVVSLLITVSTGLPINLLVPFSVPQVLAQTVEERKAEADRLLEQGQEQFQSNQFEDAIQFWQQALSIYREISNFRGESKALIGLGLAYESLGKIEQQIEFYKQWLTREREIGDPVGKAAVLNDLGIAYSTLGQYQKAIEFFQQSIFINRELGNQLKEANSLIGLGTAYRSLGQYRRAINSYQGSLVIAKKLDDESLESIALNGLGNSYYNLGEYEYSINFFQQSLTISRRLGDRDREAADLNDLGNSYNALGQYQKAIELYQESQQIFHALGNYSKEVYALGNLASSYIDIGQDLKAIEINNRLLKILRNMRIPDLYAEAMVLLNLGISYNKIGEHYKAIEIYKQSLEISQKIGNNLQQIKNLNSLGRTFILLGQYHKAIEFFQQSVNIAQEIGDQLELSRSLNNLGRVYQASNQYQQAIDFYQKSLSIKRKIGDIPGLGSTLNNLGLTLFQLGKLSEAEKFLRDSIEAKESILKNLKNDEYKVSFFEDSYDIYKNLQKVLIAQNKPKEALEIAERGRARAFVDLLAKRLSNQDMVLQNFDLLKYKTIQQIANKQKVTLIEYSIIYSDFNLESELYIWVIKPTGEIAFRKVDLKPLWQQQNTSLQELVTKNLELVSAGINRGESDNPTLSNNSSFAPGDLVRLNDDRPNYPAWQVISVNPQNRTLRLRQPSFAEGVTIERPIADVTKVSSPNAQNKRLQQLHKLLIEPIADLLPTDPNARVIFIPQGALFFVPFPALQDADNKFLIEKHTILTAPSIQVLDLTHQQRQRVPGTTKDVLVVGNPTMPEVSPFPGEPARQLSPLPAAEREATEVAQMFKTQAVIGNQATKTAILPQLPKARIIHLATHGLLDDYTGGGVPGAIALAPSTNDNGLLTASEILDLKLNAELVVLSACNTGKGRITVDGVIGLSRSLISAGVPSVVVSLWSVPDAPTASLMTEFYRQMQRSPDKAQALRQAMLTTIRTHPNPKDWAAFTLIGEAE